jgi:predicted N-acetyltransferase YhbS
MEVESLDLRAITPSDAHSVAKLLVAVWPKPGRTVETLSAEMLNRWRDYEGPEDRHPRSFVIRESGRVVAHASAYPRTIGTVAGEMTILALARVCTDPTVRGRKLGQAVTRAAFGLVDAGVFPFALFQTNEQVKTFYEQLGAIEVENHFVNMHSDDPTISPFWDKIIMRYPANAGWPSGEIDIRGPGW